MTVRGFNAAQIILASGFGGVTDLGQIPIEVAALAALPEEVRLVRASEHINFKLAAQHSDPIRRDTAIYRWIVQTCPIVVTDPQFYRSDSPGVSFELFRRVASPAKYPHVAFLRLIVKFVSTATSTSGAPELWLSTVVLHSERSIKQYVRKGVPVGA